MFNSELSNGHVVKKHCDQIQNRPIRSATVQSSANGEANGSDTTGHFQASGEVGRRPKRLAAKKCMTT